MKLGFLVFIGLPGSGKTTLAKTLKNKFKSYDGNSYQFIHVCYDHLIPVQKYVADSEWKATRNSVLLKIENLIIGIIKQNIDLCPKEFMADLENIKYNLNTVLIIDDNMYFKSMRYSLYQIAKKHNVSFCQLYLSCPLETAILQNSLRGPNSVVPSCIIKNMYHKIEPPNSENVWERYSIKINAYCDINEFCNELFTVLSDSLCNPEYFKVCDNKERSESLNQCKRSVTHQADIALRKIVNNKLKDFISQDLKNEMKDHIKKLNTRKSQILCDIKFGNINLPDTLLNEINNGFLNKSELVNFLECYF